MSPRPLNRRTKRRAARAAKSTGLSAWPIVWTNLGDPNGASVFTQPSGLSADDVRTGHREWHQLCFTG